MRARLLACCHQAPLGATGFEAMDDSNHRTRAIFLWTSALLALAIIIATRSVLLPFVLALVLAYVLTPAVSLVERTRLPRWVAVIVVYAVTLGAAYGFFWAVTPRLVQETVGLRRELPGLSEKLRDNWGPALYRKLRDMGIEQEPEATQQPTDSATAKPGATAAPRSAIRVVPNADGSFDVHLNSNVEVQTDGRGTWRIKPAELEDSEAEAGAIDLVALLNESAQKAVDYGRRNIVEVLRLGSSIVASVSRGVFMFFLTLMLGAYIMITRERILDFFRVLVRPSRRRSFDVLLARLDRGLSGVVRGQLLICAVNGVLSAIGFWLIGLKYWPILSIVAAVMSIIPIFGSILSSIPAVAIGLTQGFGTGLFVLVWIVGIHQVEANLLNPKIYGIAAKIHPVLVIFSLLVGEHFFGLFGALLAVPTMSILQNVFLHFRTTSLGSDAPTDTFIPPPPVPSTERQARVGASTDSI